MAVAAATAAVPPVQRWRQRSARFRGAVARSRFTLALRGFAGFAIAAADTAALAVLVPTSTGAIIRAVLTAVLVILAVFTATADKRSRKAESGS